MVYTTTSGVDISSIVIGGANAGNVTATARSLDAVNAKDNNIIQLTRGAGDFDTTNYVAITGWIYITKWKNEGLIISGWDDGDNVIVGIPVNIANYVSNVLNVWQSFTILLSDMGLSAVTSGFNALRFSPPKKDFKFYLDYIEIQAIGTVDPTVFNIKPDKETWLHIHEIHWSMADALNTTLASGTMPSLSYDQILGVTELSNGIAYQRVQDGEIIETATLHKLSDWLYQPGTVISDQMCDGTNTFITIKSVFTEPIILKPENNDEMRFQVNDSLVGLLWLRVSAGCKEEDRS